MGIVISRLSVPTQEQHKQEIKMQIHINDLNGMPIHDPTVGVVRGNRRLRSICHFDLLYRLISSWRKSIFFLCSDNAWLETRLFCNHKAHLKPILHERFLALMLRTTAVCTRVELPSAISHFPLRAARDTADREEGA